MKQSNGRRLLTEPMSFNYRLSTPRSLSEGLDHIGDIDDIGPDEPLILTGILQKADVLNQNGRIYPKSVLTREVDNYKKFINERRSCGELDHPEQTVVEFKNVSHLVTKIWWDGNVVMGSIEILPTSKGKEVEALVRRKVKIGVSSRGVGSTKKHGDYLMVEDDFQLICWDIVTEPSTPMAFVAPGEGVQDVDDVYAYEAVKKSGPVVTEGPRDVRFEKIKGILGSLKGRLECHSSTQTAVHTTSQSTLLRHFRGLRRALFQLDQ